MGAEKIVKIGIENENDMLRERVSLLESVLDYSTAQTIDSLRLKNKQLETEAITLRATDSEKDRLLAEKDKLITEIKNSINTKIKFREEQLRREYEERHKQSLINMRKNIRQKEVKPKDEIIEQSKEEVDRIQNMYDSLIKEFNKSHENETTILNLCSDILTNVKKLINNGATHDELVEKIDSGIKSLEKKATKTKAELIAEDKKIIQMIDDGMSDSAIADIIYNHLDDPKVRRVQLSKRKSTQRFKELVGN